MTTDTATDPWAQAREAAMDAHLDATLNGVDPVTRIDHALDAAYTTLAAHGLLTIPATRPTIDDIHETAQWLAQRSRHPRYVGDTDGWRRVLSSPGDVDLACKRATEQPGVTDEDRRHLAAARQLLQEHIAVGVDATPTPPGTVTERDHPVTDSSAPGTGHEGKYPPFPAVR